MDQECIDRVIVRPFQENDRPRVREIARNTGQKGNPTNRFFEDEEVVPILFADYYMDYEPESCFVAEVDGEVGGYMLGCKDTRNYNRVVMWRIAPRLIARVLWKVLTLQYRRKRTYMTLLWLVTRAWREVPSAPIDEYPAHVHVNIDAGFRAYGLGKKLADAMVAHLKDRGVRGLHGIIVEPEDNDLMTRKAAELYDCRVVTVNPFTSWEKFTRKKWYAKVVVKDL
jgi:ribosomal protein S18 acetylase RimI-like enzyme